MMRCVLDYSNKVQPLYELRPTSVPITTNLLVDKNDIVRKVSAILVTESTLEVLDEINELQKGTCDVIVPKKYARFQGVMVESIQDQLEVPKID